MFEAVRARAAPLRGLENWPTCDLLQVLLSSRGIVTARGAPLRLALDGGDEPYEARIYERGEMHFRERDWHDFFNVLVWLSYPRTKAALNAAQHAALRGSEPGERGPRRDALTLFDENGAIVLSSDPTLLDDLRALRWKRLFWERRSETRGAMCFFGFGHALLQKALSPYVGMTAHALLLEVSGDFVNRAAGGATEALDTLAATAIPSICAPRVLSPLPVLGVPGWWRDNEHAAFYENAAYFRTSRSRNPVETLPTRCSRGPL